MRIRWLRSGLVIGILVWLLAGCGGDEMSTQEVRAELLEMRDRDQRVRELFIATGMQDTVLAARVREMDSLHSVRLREIIDQYGFPTAAKVGDSALAAAFLLVQHADHDPDMQFEALPYIRRAAERGDLRREAVALLTDRVLLATRGEQVYGTQFDLTDSGFVALPIHDSVNVDKRRAEMDLPPLEEYRKKLEEVYGVQGE